MWERLHMEAPEFRQMFARSITPTDVDWFGFVDLAARCLVTLEFKRDGCGMEPGQAQAMREWRRRMLPGDWWILIHHDAVPTETFPGVQCLDIWPENVTDWRGFIGGALDIPSATGHGHQSLSELVSSLDSFGRPLARNGRKRHD
jgi:hypothetical protein